MAVVGGTFVPVDNVAFFDIIGNLSLHRWGQQGFTALSTDNATLSEILPNILALSLMTIVFFGVAVQRFNKRFEI